MKSLASAKVLSETKERLRRLTPEDRALWGKMSARDWMRWGYLHADHHLRQFGR